MAQPPATNIHYRNNTSTTNQPPQLLTNIRSTQIAAKKKKKKTHNQRETEWKADREEREKGEINDSLGVRSPVKPKPITG